VILLFRVSLVASDLDQTRSITARMRSGLHQRRWWPTACLVHPSCRISRSLAAAAGVERLLGPGVEGVHRSVPPTLSSQPRALRRTPPEPGIH